MQNPYGSWDDSGPMTFGKFMKWGCVSILGIFVLLVIVGLIGEAMMTPAERQKMMDARIAAAAKAEADERAATEKTRQDAIGATTSLLHKLTLLHRAAPRPDQLQEKLLPAAFHDVKINYDPCDYAFLAQFTEAGFEPTPNPYADLWYRSKDFAAIESALLAAKAPADRNTTDLAKAAASFDQETILAIFYPLEQKWPAMLPSTNEFDAGQFLGWVVLMDLKTLETIGETKFEARNSSKVTKTRLKVAGIPVGSGLATAVAQDFTDNFWAAAGDAIGYLQKPESRPHAASTP